MKRLVLSLTLLSSLVFAGNKIKFTDHTIMCANKVPDLKTYYVLLFKTLINEGSVLDSMNIIHTDSNSNCSLLNSTMNITGEILQKQKDIFNSIPMEYIKFKFLSRNGKDISSSNMIMWAVQMKNNRSYVAK
jgi:hypothetical protein